ncbi:GlsB/YeaQ/YmgE family stress response membrane protein [uncultured Sneathiella sp.]|uniref:GlsB/YeaQ/YmgE family stress response membrane protein n=1 Tax=uncultured Sneathiella sp. TaxID=879315 RepID=UPI002593CBC4|nr:GlsB/YeaQ/YmgE family stress response membrane protein [uncultured Sneathiella sp.]
MGLESLLIFLLIGAVAGWLAGLIIKGFGFGLIGNIIVGIIGAFLAGFILPQVGIDIGGGILGAIIHATIGAVLFLFIIKLIKSRG